ncbi:transmembrane protein 209-like [Haliotis rufescens]|uniref:transmembrane protein 209-like n=1 Tax=Haliotis rufescens TaxID=6454 RepID=UPI00201F1CB7|nr:transmembrane protein 209-like [Haliotis rufescens]
MARLAPGSSPVVEKTFRKRHGKVVARKAISSAVFILVIIMLLFIDMSYSTISSYFGLAHPAMWYFECVGIIFWLFRLVPSIVYLVSYTRDYFFGEVVELTEEQARLLRVQKNERGFKVSPRKPVGDQSAQNSFIFSASTPVTQTSFASDGSRHSPSSYLSQSPYGGSFMFSQHSPTAYQSVSSSTLSPSHSQSFDRSANLSSANNSSTRFDVSDHSGLRSRHNATYTKLSPASTYDTISDMSTLARYLKEQEEKERRGLQASPDTSSQGASFWSFGSSPMDHVNVLRKYQYQVATRSPQSPTAKASSSDQSVSSGLEEVWSSFGVTEDNLYLWTERLRKWLSLTLIIKLANELERVNNTLRCIGCEELQAGDVSVSTLKQLALTKGNFVPSLNTIIPYLDVSSNQEYVVKRIRDLATGAMSAFAWNSGGSYGKPWGEHLPTDSVLLMHLLCTYLDSLLPTQPRYPDGKTFTSQHFVKTPDQPDQGKKDAMYMYQVSINPPHFQVIIGDETFNLPKGRNNMFQAILLFFFYIKMKRGGMLGRVNIGMSGLNIMWIFN